MPETEEKEKVAEFIELRSPQQKLDLLCDRIARCYRNGMTVAVYAPDPEEAGQIDDALWTFRQDSFVPHVQWEQAGEPLIEPVIIFTAEPGEPASDVLFIASAGGTAPWLGRFPHVYDFAPIYDEELKKAARERFNWFKEAGYRMRFIKP